MAGEGGATRPLFLMEVVQHAYAGYFVLIAVLGAVWLAFDD